MNNLASTKSLVPNTSSTNEASDNEIKLDASCEGNDNDQDYSILNSNFSTTSRHQFLRKESKEKLLKDDKKNNNTERFTKSNSNGINNLQSHQKSMKNLSSALELRKNSNDRKKDKKGRHRKKKSWYSNILYPTYKSRSDSFKKIFKNVPGDERLIVDYSCALQREILVHGRLYVTQNYLCFYANIFMWETLVTLRWKDVTSITKEKTALVIPNALSIHTTAGEKFFFASFYSRDKTFLMLFKVWQNSLMSKPMSVSEMWQLVHDSYGKELGLSSDDEDYLASLLPRSGDDKSTPDNNTSFNLLAEMEKLESQNNESSLVQNVKSLLPEDLSENPTDTSESDVEKNSSGNSQTYTVKCTGLHNERVAMNCTFPINVDELFELLFTSSKFFLDFHTARHTTDLYMSDWIQDNKNDPKKRRVSMKIRVNPEFKKTSQVTEVQTLLPCSTPGKLYSIAVDTQNSGVMFSDAFIVKTHYCLSRVTKNKSSLKVYYDIHYTKYVAPLTKILIEKGCQRGVQEYYKNLEKALNVDCEKNVEIMKNDKTRQCRVLNGGTILQKNFPDNTAFDHQQSMIELSTEPKALDQHKEDNSTLSWIILIAVICLIFINCLLYYKLSTNLEEPDPYTKMDLHVLKNTPKTEDDWINLLQQQESLHTVEVKKWQRVLHTTIQLLKQTEESLVQLQMSVHPTATEKVISVLKPGFKMSQREL